MVTCLCLSRSAVPGINVLTSPMLSSTSLLNLCNDLTLIKYLIIYNARHVLVLVKACLLCLLYQNHSNGQLLGPRQLAQATFTPKITRFRHPRFSNPSHLTTPLSKRRENTTYYVPRSTSQPPSSLNVLRGKDNSWRALSHSLSLSICLLFFSLTHAHIHHISISHINTKKEKFPEDCRFHQSTVWVEKKLFGCCPFPYILTFPVLAIIWATFLFSQQKGSLNRNNSFVWKVKTTVCWRPDTRGRSWCIERVKAAENWIIDSFNSCFF